MPSSKNNDYVVEKILEKRIGRNGQSTYLVKWKGYSSEENTWEPESHVTNCQDLIKAFEAEQAKKKDVTVAQQRTSDRSTRSSLSRSTKSGNKSEKSSPSSNRNSPAHQLRKRPSINTSYFTDDQDDDDDGEYVEKKSIKPIATKRTRKNTGDSDITPSIDSNDSDILDTAKLDRILDVRRNKKTDTVEYYIQLKQIKKAIWSKSNQLTEYYTQQVIDFLEEKYV